MILCAFKTLKLLIVNVVKLKYYLKIPKERNARMHSSHVTKFVIRYYSVDINANSNVMIKTQIVNATAIKT